MNFEPFVRYVHYIPLSENSAFPSSVPYDNRLFFMHSGECAIGFSDKEIKLSSGDAVIIPSGTEYQIKTPESSATLLAVNFDFTQANTDKSTPIPPVASELYDEKLKLEAEVQTPFGTDIAFPIYIKSMQSISSRLVRLEREHSAKLIYYDKLTSAMLKEILYLLARADSTAGYDSERIGEIIGYINENFGRRITNHDIARRFGLHPIYISDLVKNHTGMPLHKYLINIRIGYSVEFLESGRYSIGEIAEMCGFCDIYHFSKIFKKVMGVSPTKYV